MGQPACGACLSPIPTSDWNSPYPLPCAHCSRPVSVRVFPAALRLRAPAMPEQILAGGEAACYNHPQYRAAVACDECGRFLCRMCDLGSGEPPHVCPACLERRETTSQHERVNHDSIALALATLPMLTCWLTVFTTPVALFLTARSWNDPSAVFQRGRWRLWTTLGVAVLQLLIVVFAVYVWYQTTAGRTL